MLTDLATTNDDVLAKRFQAVAVHCMELALKFWHLDRGLEVTLSQGELEEGSSGLCQKQPRYKRAVITYDVHQISDMEELWEVVAHEFAHLAIMEFDFFHHFIQVGMTGLDEDIVGHHYRDQMEQVTSRLTTVFLDRHPYDELKGELETLMDAAAPL